MYSVVTHYENDSFPTVKFAKLTEAEKYFDDTVEHERRRAKAGLPMAVVSVARFDGGKLRQIYSPISDPVLIEKRRV